MTKIINRKGQYPRLSAADARRLAALKAKSLALNGDVIAAGFGHVRYSDLRKVEHPAIAAMLAVDEEIFDIYAQWERETGLKSVHIR